jgi:hypothetical protein
MVNPIKTIVLTQEMADGLNNIPFTPYISNTNAPKDMAAIVFLLSKLDDRTDWFPGGRQNTVNVIFHQLEAWASFEAVVMNRTELTP